MYANQGKCDVVQVALRTSCFNLVIGWLLETLMSILWCVCWHVKIALYFDEPWVDGNKFLHCVSNKGHVSIQLAQYICTYLVVAGIEHGLGNEGITKSSNNILSATCHNVHCSTRIHIHTHTHFHMEKKTALHALTQVVATRSFTPE